MNIFLYFRTYWGPKTGPGWSGRNVLARNKMEMVRVCIRSLELQYVSNIYTCAFVDNSTTSYTKFLSENFDEVMHTSEGFDVDDHKGRWPIWGGAGNLIKVLEYINSKKHQDNDIVLLLEDDYLFVHNGFREWIKACQNIDGFVTPFDHPDRYYRNDDIFFKNPELHIINNMHFRTSESTTSVVGGKAKFFKKTYLLRKIPRMHFWFFWPERLWNKELPSIDRVFYRRAYLFLRIKLFSPIPGLATHLSKFIPPQNKKLLSRAKELPATQLSPNVDWENRFNCLKDDGIYPADIN